ncbi:response regulator [Phenylobacterium aquaticum]|uniref:response regulator n=1 Tax=Phenylobacterium aquaticum TaxID=1763816 RepID=UPI001F5C66C1|nr:response regulator [Phenylobacterium aquaticum]MCI3133012.1 response regulator [Phenylobacterium aquaticum]
MDDPGLTPGGAGLEALALDRLARAVCDRSVCMLDEAGIVIGWNAGGARQTQYEAAEILGESFARFYTPEDRKTGLPAEALRIARRDGLYEAEGWRMRRDGTSFWVRVAIEAVTDAAGRRIGFAQVMTDITAQREAEARRRAEGETVPEATGLERRSRDLAHDVNNLLSVIIAGAELGLRGAGEPERATLLFEQILRAARQGDELVEAVRALGQGAAAHGVEAPPAPAYTAGGETPQRMAPRPGGPHVLVVDDDPALALLASQLLGHLGCQAEVAHSAQAALDRLAAAPDFDLLFCDIMMPGGLSGVALGKRVREAYPTMSILLTTGYSDRLQYLSDFPMLRKPYDLDALEAAVAALTPAQH